MNSRNTVEENMNISDLRGIIEYGRIHGGCRTALYKGKNNDEPLSFEETSEIISSAGNYILSEGLRECNIAILSENRTEWSLCFFAIANSGNVVVPLDRALPEEELLEMIKKCECKAVFYSEKDQKTIDYVADNLPGIKFYHLEEIYRFADSGRKLKEEGKDLFSEVMVNENTLASIVFTSGTSGGKKGVMLSHGNLASDVVSLKEVIEAGNTTILLPMHHTFIWAAGMFAMFIYVVDAHISTNMKRIVKDLKKNSPQNISAVPMMVEMLYKGIWNNARKEGKEKNLKAAIRLSRFLMKLGIDRRRQIFREIHENFGGRLEIIICGGAALDMKLQENLYDLGITIINGYGITECSPVVAVNGNNDFRFGSVGRPLSCNRVRISDPDEKGIGEICVSGSNVMKGYYKDPEATAEAFDGEWFKTGDTGYIDRDGYLFITGRTKNLIVLSNGENVAPEEIEERFNRLEYVKEVAVYEEDNVITAEFYLDNDNYPQAKTRLEVDVDLYNRSVPNYRNINKIKYRSTPFTKTTTMKIKRYLLKEGERP